MSVMPSYFARALVLVPLLASPSAHAGACLEQEASADAGMKWIEAFAKNKHAKMGVDTDGLPWMCVRYFVQREAARIKVACEPIIDRDGDSSPCVELAAQAGYAKLGTHDLFEIISRRKEDPFDSPGNGDWPRINAFGNMADARAVPVIMSEWKAALARREKLKHHSAALVAYSSWRQLAAIALGKVGGPEEQAFLVEQLPTAENRYLKAAYEAAIKAIAARAAQ
jgi:hypothetical protein